MDEEDYEDYLVDKAKEILSEEIVESREDDAVPDKKDLVDGKKTDSPERIPMSWDPQEIDFLAKNRTRMSNKQIRKFAERDSKFHDLMDEIDEWKGFTRWEERLMVQQHSVKSTEEIAEELDRETKEVELKLHMMGLVAEDEF